MDMNDRSLRSIVVDLGGVANGYPRQDGFDITVASEMVISQLDIQGIKKQYVQKI